MHFHNDDWAELLHSTRTLFFVQRGAVQRNDETLLRMFALNMLALISVQITVKQEVRAYPFDVMCTLLRSAVWCVDSFRSLENGFV